MAASTKTQNKFSRQRLSATKPQESTQARTTTMAQDRFNDWSDLRHSSLLWGCPKDTTVFFASSCTETEAHLRLRTKNKTSIALLWSIEVFVDMLHYYSINQGKLERSPVVIVTACMKARKYKTLIRTALTMGRQQSIQIQPVATQQYVIGYKAVCRIKDQEIGQDQECQHAFAHLPLCELGIVYPTTESVDDLDASRTGIHHHLMYTNSSHSSMLSHMN